MALDPSEDIDHLKDSVVISAGDWLPGAGYKWLIHFFVPLAGTILLGWWLWLSFTAFAPDQWYNPFTGFSPSTVLLQWGVVLLIFGLFNKKIAKLES
ncbi:MAG: hypothetical protein ACK4VN_15260 [Bacteroidales bacterium]